MDILDILTNLLSLIIGGAIGSFLTFKVVKKTNNQNNNTVENGNMVNGNFNNGNNNTNIDSNE